MATTITFNSFNLNDGTDFKMKTVNRYNAPKRTVQTLPLSFQDNAKVVTSFWGPKVITVNGFVFGTSEQDLQSNISTAMTALAIPEATLAIPYNGLTLNYTATYIPGSDDFPRQNYNITYCEYNLTFEAVNPPFGVSSATSTDTRTGDTAASISDSLTMGGNVPSKPIITLDINSATALTTIEFANVTTGESITITETFSGGDTVIINTKTKAVTINGAEVDYAGVFPVFVVGANSYSIDYTSTAHNVDSTITWQNYYL